MAVESKPASKKKMILIWALVVGNVLVLSTYFLWRAAHQEPPTGRHQPDLVYSIIMFGVGCFFLVAGTGSYFAVLFTNCLTFDFTRPVWSGVKKRLFLCNIVVPVLFLLGVGFLISTFVTPLLAASNLPGNLSFMLPIMGTFVVLQTASVWVGIWTPLDKRLIQRRLMALGIRPEQFVAGWYVGLSNSAITSSVKRFGGIEEDIGMLWFTPAQLIYYGDSQQFSLTRQQLMDVERRADSKSVTMLSGTRHVILHVLMPDGNTSQIRLHNENVWTMGGKKRVAEELGNRIDAWRTEATTA